MFGPVLHHDGLSRPLENPTLTVLSLGVGVQSSTLLLMADRGELGRKPDVAIHAKLERSEPRAVGEYLEFLRATVSIPIVEVSAGSLYQEIIDASDGVANAYARPPLFVINERTGEVGFTRRQCTQGYKIEPITKAVREMLGLQRGRRGPKTPVVEQWIGISTDEITRLKHSRFSYIHNRHPLIEARMSRRDCIRWLEERQYPVPPKSACTFCPFHTNAMWRDIRDNDPESWAQALEVDAALARGLKNLKSRGYLHRTCKPLAEVDLGSPDAAGFDFANECEGMCGV